jgi:fatty acid desaturase
MIELKHTKFKNPVLNQLQIGRVTTELQALQSEARKAAVLKSLLAIALLVIAAAAIFFCPISLSVLGFGLGIFILSTFAIDHYRQEWQRVNRLFAMAKASLSSKRANEGEGEWPLQVVHLSKSN